MRLCVHFLFLWSTEIGTFLGGGGESPAEFGLGGPDCRDAFFSVKDQLSGERQSPRNEISFEPTFF